MVVMTASGCALFFLAVKALRLYVARDWAATAGFIIFAIPGPVYLAQNRTVKIDNSFRNALKSWLKAIASLSGNWTA